MLQTNKLITQLILLGGGVIQTKLKNKNYITLISTSSIIQKYFSCKFNRHFRYNSLSNNLE